jgi:ABC-2 type transport system ATP-binding protein
VVHVLADAAPAPGFTPVEAGLEDVYFSTLHAQRREVAAAGTTLDGAAA